MKLREDLISFYRQQYRETLHTLIHIEEGDLARAGALNQTQHLTRQLRFGLTVEKETIRLSDVFDPGYTWWFQEHSENMLRIAGHDPLIRAYADFMQDKVFNAGAEEDEKIICVARVRNDLRQYIKYAMKTMLDRTTTPRDLGVVKRQLMSKINHASKLDSVGYRVDIEVIHGMFEESLLRDKALMQRYTASQQFGCDPQSKNGFAQLQDVLIHCDIPDLEIDMGKLQRFDETTEEQAQKKENIKQAQKALIDVLDAVTDQRMNYAQGARAIKQSKAGMDEGSLKDLMASVKHYQRLTGSSERPQKEKAGFKISSLFGSEKESVSTTI